VQSDLTVTPFNNAKDLVKQTVKAGNWEARAQALIPPGLTADCVVDLHYSIESQLTHSWMEIPIQGAYPVRMKRMEVATNSGLGSVLLCQRSLLYEKVSTLAYDFYTFTDLPGEEKDPYSIPGLWSSRFLFFQQIYWGRIGQAKEPEAYWKAIAEDLYKPAYTESLKFGRRYRDWSKALREGLEGDASTRAATILARLEREIQNGSQLTQAEFAALGKKSAEESMEHKDLDAAVQRKRASATGMHYLFFQLLSDEGLEPRLLLVADRNQHPFRYHLMAVRQFTDVLLGVTGKDGFLTWFDPSTRFLPAGVVDPAYQETEGLLLESRNWTCRPFKLVHQDAAVNGSRYEFSLDLGGTQTFTEHATFKGYPEHRERLGVFQAEPRDQEKTLKEAVEGRDKNVTVTRVKVDHATEPGVPLTWNLEGACPLEGGRRKVFAPFPGLPSPMFIPDAWPPKRTQPILLPYCFQWSAVSRFKVPEGWKLARDPDLAQANGFGKVAWRVEDSVEDGETRAVVTFTVDLETMAADPVHDAALRQFLSWIETASRRTLSLERL
jgi:hypothetical protein